MTLDFTFWDVNHGSAAHVSTPNNTHIAVDLGTGTYEDSSQPFSPLLHLKNSGIAQLDEVILTHPHRDHLDDIFNFDELSPRVLVRPKHLTRQEILAGNKSTDRKVIDKYFEIDARYSHPVPGSNDPEASANNGGVVIQRFTPTSSPRDNLNNHSVVTLFAFARSKLLLPGDNEPSSWEELLKRDDFRSAVIGTDILVAPHHGRASGYSDLLFDYVSPKLTIISDGSFCDTSATSRYSAKTTGWAVHKRSGGKETRKCVTTRNDGVITVTFGFNDASPYIHVTIA